MDAKHPTELETVDSSSRLYLFGLMCLVTGVTGRKEGAPYLVVRGGLAQRGLG